MGANGHLSFLIQFFLRFSFVLASVIVIPFFSFSISGLLSLP